MANTPAAGPTGFAHMLLKVSDITRSERFIALTSGGPGEPTQIDHIAFTASDVRAIAARLKRADVKFFRDLHDGIYGLTIYIADPDGNMIELYEADAKM